MFEQNLQVAAQVNDSFKEKVLEQCLKQMSSFLHRWDMQPISVSALLHYCQYVSNICATIP